MATYNSSVITSISDLEEVREIVLAGANIRANQILLENGAFPIKVQDKRKSLAKRIKNSDSKDEVLSGIALDIMQQVDPTFFNYVVDYNDVANAINDDIWNQNSKVVSEDY